MSETDSKLIASTLQALKDIVSVEASAGESQFMTGAVETSSFGTFAISANNEAKLVMSYIISVPHNETVPEDLENTIQKICTNFGKQLTQVKNIAEMAKQGQRIPSTLVNQAYQNAVTIVQLDTNIDKNIKQFEQDLESEIDSIFRENGFQEIMQQVLDEDFIQNKDNWYGGHPTKTAMNNLLMDISILIIQRLIENDPISLLNSPNPRSEYKRVSEILRRRFRNKFENFTSLVVEKFGELIEEGYEDFVTSLSVYQLHTAGSLIYNEFLKRSITSIAKRNPSVFLYDFDKSELRVKTESLIPPKKIPHFGDVMIETVTRYAPPHTWNLIHSFYETLIRGMSGRQFSVSAVDLGLLFAQYFIEPKVLKSEIAKNDTMNNQWKNQLLSLIPPTKITTLEVNSIEEANQLASAAGNTIINVLVEIINQYFIGSESQIGELPVRFAQFYNDISPKIKTSNVILAIFKGLEQIDADLEFIVPEAIDLIGVYMMEHNLDFYVDGTRYETNKKLFGPYVAESEDESVLFIKKLNTLQKFQLVIDDQTYDINLRRFKFSDLPQILLDENNIINSIEVVGERKIKAILVPAFHRYIQSYVDEIDQIISGAQENSLVTSELTGYQFVVDEFEFDKYNYGNYIHTENLKLVENLKSNIINRFNQDLSEFLKRIDGGDNQSKYSKIIKKSKEGIIKQSESLISEYEDKLLDNLSDYTNHFKKQKKLIQETINSNEILHYKFNSDALVTPVEDMKEILERYTERKYGDSLRKDENLRFNLGVKLFDTLSNSTFEDTYDKLINNSIDSRLKKIQEKAGSKSEFELKLRDIGRAEAYDLFRSFEDILNKASSLYINQDGVVSIDSNFLKLHLGRLKLSKYPRKELITNLIKLPNIVVERDGDSWLISYGFTKVSRNDESIPNIITFRDTVHYIHKLELYDELNDILVALKEVGKLIEDETHQRIENVRNELFNSIFTEN